MIKGKPINWDRVVLAVGLGMWAVLLLVMAFGDLSEWAI
jgi:hypothetical protein